MIAATTRRAVLTGSAVALAAKPALPAAPGPLETGWREYWRRSRIIEDTDTVPDDKVVEFGSAPLQAIHDWTPHGDREWAALICIVGQTGWGADSPPGRMLVEMAQAALD